jgi:hypothetical protein
MIRFLWGIFAIACFAVSALYAETHDYAMTVVAVFTGLGFIGLATGAD